MLVGSRRFWLKNAECLEIRYNFIFEVNCNNKRQNTQNDEFWKSAISVFKKYYIFILQFKKKSAFLKKVIPTFHNFDRIKLEFILENYVCAISVTNLKKISHLSSVLAL